MTVRENFYMDIFKKILSNHKLSSLIAVKADNFSNAKTISSKFGQSDYPRTPQDTPGHPRTLQDSIICMFNILYEPVDDGLVLVCWCIN